MAPLTDASRKAICLREEENIHFADTNLEGGMKMAILKAGLAILDLLRLCMGWGITSFFWDRHPPHCPFFSPEGTICEFAKYAAKGKHCIWTRGLDESSVMLCGLFKRAFAFLSTSLTLTETCSDLSDAQKKCARVLTLSTSRIHLLYLHGISPLVGNLKHTQTRKTRADTQDENVEYTEMKETLQMISIVIASKLARCKKETICLFLNWRLCRWHKLLFSCDQMPVFGYSGHMVFV